MENTSLIDCWRKPNISGSRTLWFQFYKSLNLRIFRQKSACLVVRRVFFISGCCGWRKKKWKKRERNEVCQSELSAELWRERKRENRGRERERERERERTDREVERAERQNEGNKCSQFWKRETLQVRCREIRKKKTSETQTQSGFNEIWAKCHKARHDAIILWWWIWLRWNYLWLSFWLGATVVGGVWLFFSLLFIFRIYFL